MSARTILFGERTLGLLPGESVLDGLLRHGVDIGHSCRAGHCQACLVRGTPAPERAQVGLKPTQVAQGYFLACQATACEHIELHATTAGAPCAATVTERTLLGEDVLRLRLVTEGPLDYAPGQFVHLAHPSGAVRSYSLASHLEQLFLELHVRRVPGGLVSGWLHDDVRVGDALTLRGPHGSCFYAAGHGEQPLVLAGAGTGLAPLWGIAHDALQKGHRGPIHLIQGALHADRLYLVDELRDLASAAGPLEVHFGALHGANGDVRSAPLDALAAEVAGKLDAPRAFLCGDPGLVKAMQRRLFLAGVASANILADPFLPVPTPAPTGPHGHDPVTTTP